MTPPIHRARCVSSTQDVLRSLLEAGGVEEGEAVVALEQEAGRGRHGRRWQSPPGGLYLSVLLRSHPLLSLHAGLAVARALREEGLEARLKWPNDVLLSDRKVAGILVEIAQGWALVGVGMNVSQSPLPGATSVAERLGRPVSLDALLERVLRELRSPPGGVLSSYRDASATIGRCVAVTVGEGPSRREITGRATGVDPLGRLLVETEAGLEAVAAGCCRHLAVDAETG